MSFPLPLIPMGLPMDFIENPCYYCLTPWTILSRRHKIWLPQFLFPILERKFVLFCILFPCNSLHGHYQYYISGYVFIWRVHSCLICVSLLGKKNVFVLNQPRTAWKVSIRIVAKCMLLIQIDFLTLYNKTLNWRLSPK